MAVAQTVVSAPYDVVAAQTAGLLDFEAFPTIPEPGQAIHGLLHAPGMTLGEGLAGQVNYGRDGFDVLSGSPTTPISVYVGDEASLAVAYHAGFGSNAAFPLGPDGFAKRSGRGEGALAFDFELPVSAFALRLHADYSDPLGSRPAPGPIWLHFFDANGELMHEEEVFPDTGIQNFGFLSSHPIHAITLTHRDPGGIAIDDIRYSLEALTN
ncbi:hypothetical protein [Aliiroseovarius sp. F20344]|uniref:hypothetical protein n=1 Tax=Aliiroseovarius sp. F20344 TaxID=2926414 RepID=UPI001FF36FCB|nr:hypothetical protein [Aliiroseovarius sp. F20344]MCK0142331.1 hypothetical protein [Aliiroseovarius sp. F20344]